MINRAYQVLQAKIPAVEYLISNEGDIFSFTGNAERDLLSITAVHPMREEAVNKLLFKAGMDWDLVRRSGLPASIRTTVSATRIAPIALFKDAA